MEFLQAMCSQALQHCFLKVSVNLRIILRCSCLRIIAVQDKDRKAEDRRLIEGHEAFRLGVASSYARRPLIIYLVILSAVVRGARRRNIMGVQAFLRERATRSSPFS